MTPNKYAVALKRLHGALATSRAAAVFESLRPHSATPKPDVPALLQVFASLSAAQAQFGEAERSLLTAFGLQPVTETAWWATLITAHTRGSLNDAAVSMVEDVHARLQVAATTFPALAGLFDRAPAMPPLDVGGLAILLPGLDGAPPSLTRVASAIEAVNQLWSVAEDLTGHRGALRLIRTVPGPTMALHFDGHPEPLDELRILLASIWDQMARLSGVPADQHPALVAEMLPVMQRIGQSSRSDALRVRSAVEGGVCRLLEAGCTLPVVVSPDSHAPSPGAEALQGPSPASVPAWAKPAVAKLLDEQEIGHLAAVIAEERSRLTQSEPSRRQWQAAVHPA